MSSQPMLDGLQVTFAVAVNLAIREVAYDGNRKVGKRAQRQVLKYVARYTSKSCWLGASTIANELDLDEKTVRGALNVLVEQGLLKREGPQNRRTHSIGPEQTASLKAMIPQAPETSPSAAPSGANGGQWEPGTNARIENRTNARMEPDKCPDGTGHLQNQCPVEPGICPVEPGINARHKKELNNQLKQTTTESPVVVGGSDFVSLGEHDPTWTDSETERIGAVLQQLGVKQWHNAVKTAKALHWSTTDVEAVIDDWRESGLPKGALGNRLLHPDEPVEKILRKRRNAQLRSPSGALGNFANVTYPPQVPFVGGNPFESPVSRENTAQRLRSDVLDYGNHEGFSQWASLANVAKKLERKQLSEFITEDERSASAIYERIDALADQYRDNPELKADLKRLVRDVGDMPASQVESQLGELEQRTADDCRNESGTANIEAGTEAEKEQLCKRC